MNTNQKLQLLDELLMGVEPSETSQQEYAAIAMLRLLYLNGVDEKPIKPAMRAFHAGPPGTKDDLPPMVPIGRPRPADVSCPVCGKGKGQPCVRMSKKGSNGDPTNELLLNGKGRPAWHTRRGQKAMGR